MPPIQAAVLKNLARAAFKAQAIVLPIDWEQPTGEAGKQYVDAFKPYERFAPIDPSKLFTPATPNKLHGDTAKEISEPVQKFCHDAVNKFKQAIDMWKLQAEFKSVQIMAVCCIGPPGALKGPELKSLAPFSSWKGKEDNEKAYIKAVVEGLSGQWKKWQDKVMIPGLPFYPAFAAFPLAQAPPMPNIPMPLITCPSAMMAEMTQMKLKKAMVDALDGGVKDKDKDKQHEAIFDTIAFPIALNFLLWLVMQMVMNLLGKGPVPPYAPPYIPVGPVVGGSEALGKALMA